MAKKIPIRCPCSRNARLVFKQGRYFCSMLDCCHSNEGMAFSVIGEGVPVLVSEEYTDTFIDSKSITSYVKRSPSSWSYLKKNLFGESKSTVLNAGRFVARLKELSSAPRVLVIGSGQKGSGTDCLWKDSLIDIHGIDVYLTDTVDIVCDAHYLPLESDFYDGVWIQAVLEHVVEPSRVVSEIFRVLSVGGIVYAETPFMQQVHEGGYDFTRYTVLGHRYLFRSFELIDVGGNGGPEVVLAWSFRYFFWGITGSKKISAVSYWLCRVFLKPFGLLMKSGILFDGPSGVYFMGRKVLDNKVTHKDLPKLYKGFIR